MAKGKVSKPTPKKPTKASVCTAAGHVTRASSASELASEALPDSDGPPTPSARRRLERRDTDAAVDRVIETRLLRKYDLSVIEGARNSKGESVRQALGEQLKANRSTKKNLSSQFWTKLISDFKLNTSVVDKLDEPDPSDLEHVSPQLIEKMSIARSDNPAARSSEPLERFLEDCPELRYVELYGILHVCIECPLVVRSASVRMLVAVLKYFARINGLAI